MLNSNSVLHVAVDTSSIPPSRKVAKLQVYIEEEADRKVDALISRRVEDELAKRMPEIQARLEERVRKVRIHPSSVSSNLSLCATSCRLKPSWRRS